MEISKEQPMRPAEIQLVDLANELEKNLAQEIKDRQKTDEALQKNIDNEAQTRQKTDTTLQTAITNEETNRVNNDNILQQNIEKTKTELQTMFSEFTDQLEWGSQDEIEVIANNNTVITVTFTEEKESTPIVLITLQNDDGETQVNAYASLKDISTTEFHVRIYNLDKSNNQKLRVNWLAIGK